MAKLVLPKKAFKGFGGRLYHLIPAGERLRSGYMTEAVCGAVAVGKTAAQIVDLEPEQLCPVCFGAIVQT